METATEILKFLSRKEHAATEKTLIEKLKSIHDINDYINILTLFYGYFAPIEKEIEKFITPDILPDIKSRKRSKLIVEDLRKLEYTTPLCTAEDLPKIDNYVQAAGAMYVLEGSTLGGQHIAQMLAANPILQNRKDAMTFFAGYKEQTFSKWQSFKDHIDASVLTDEVDQVVQSTIQTFVLLDRWILNKNNDKERNN